MPKARARRPTPVLKRPRGRPRRPKGMVRFVVYVPDGLKKWCKHRAIDEDCDMSTLATEALQLLEADRGAKDRRKRSQSAQ